MLEIHTNYAEDAASGLIDAINYVNLMDFSDITISDDASDGLIATDINAGNSTDCYEGAAGGLIADINTGVLINCADIFISDDAEDGLINTTIDVYEFITTPIDADGLIATPIKSTDCADTNVLDDAVDRLTMLIF